MASGSSPVAVVARNPSGLALQHLDLVEQDDAV